MQQRISANLVIDNSLAYLVGAITVVVFGLAAFAVRAGDLGSMILDDEVKVEAAQFPFQPKSDMDIFTGGCNGKIASCKK